MGCHFLLHPCPIGQQVIVGQRQKARGKKQKTIFLQKLTVTPSSGATLENTGLLRCKLDQMVNELQPHHRPFSLRYTVQWSAAQTKGGRKSFMCFTFTCLPSNPRAEIQLGVGWGQNILLQRGCIIDGEKPTWSFRQPRLNWQLSQRRKNPQQTPCALFYSSQLSF